MKASDTSAQGSLVNQHSSKLQQHSEAQGPTSVAAGVGSCAG